MTVDVTNEDPKYWERILAASNLSTLVEEPQAIEITAEEFKELANLELLPEEDYEYEGDPVIHFRGITKDTDILNADHSGLNETNDELRTKIDSDDTFFTGHRIIKERRGNRECPVWAVDFAQQCKLLLRAFPKLATNAKQRASAGRWARVIQMYFRSQMTEGQVAKELNMTVKSANSIIRSILRTSKGKRANGSGLRTRKRAVV